MEHFMSGDDPNFRADSRFDNNELERSDRGSDRSGILLHNSNPSVCHHQQGDNYPLDIIAAPSQARVFETSTPSDEKIRLTNLYGEETVNFYNSVWEDFPECDFSITERSDRGITNSAFSASSLNIGDYGIREAEVKDGILVITNPETLSPAPSIGLDYTPVTEEMMSIDAGQSSQLEGASSNFPTERLLVEKKLSSSDIRSSISGVLLPRKQVELHFPGISDQHQLTLHDGAENGKVWTMPLKIESYTDCLKYKLNNSRGFIMYHSLAEGDLLQICQDLQWNRLVLKFVKLDPILANTGMDAWKPVIRKTLTKSDIRFGLQASGSIFLSKKDVKNHFPHVEDKGGYLVNFHDSEANRFWEMRLKFKCEQSAGRVYMLHDIGEFLELHTLEEGDMIEIWKIESVPPKYRLTTKKSL